MKDIRNESLLCIDDKNNHNILTKTNASPRNASNEEKNEGEGKERIGITGVFFFPCKSIGYDTMSIMCPFSTVIQRRGGFNFFVVSSYRTGITGSLPLLALLGVRER